MMRDLGGDIDRGRRSSASRKSGKLSHSQVNPSSSTTPGISSTPSINSISAPRCCGRTGAKPTPQLPNIVVVTPCQQEGPSSGSHIACPS
jgi:hypothetical protein